MASVVGFRCVDDRPAPSRRTLRVHVEGMTCASCVGRVEKVPTALPEATRATVNLATERDEVAFCGEPDPAVVARAIESTGHSTADEATELSMEHMATKGRPELTAFVPAQGFSQDEVLGNVLRLKGFRPPMTAEPRSHPRNDDCIGLSTVRIDRTPIIKEVEMFQKTDPVVVINYTTPTFPDCRAIEAQGVAATLRFSKVA
ncbi:heavy-metal-associated domain-containing protein [Microvirga arabica]|uniref:heavy-metal-associated domain-containing protein n=1 Tax=Microvirga arabica TaxID=1128671 RepID=UPI001939F54A|nr:heavy-metal-associated domain-containing protein [Microvirga arabica]